MQENRFTYSPAFDASSLRGPLSFQEFQNRNTSYTQPSELPKWVPQSTFTPNVYTSNLPLNKQVTFAKSMQSTGEPVRITFNQNGTTSFVPTYPTTAVSVPSAVISPIEEINKKTNGPAPALRSEKVGEVNTFVVDTNDFKYVKEDEFTGCFHCFSPVTYDTKIKKGLCG